MRNLFIVYTLGLSSIGFADQGYELCCPSIPKESICWTCNTPQFYDLQCDWGIFVSVDFLYWYAHEDDLVFAEKQVFTPQSPDISPEGVGGCAIVLPTLYLAPEKDKSFGMKWQPGVRASVGRNLPCDGWDLYASWTWYHNEKQSSMLTTHQGLPLLSGDNFLINPWIHPSMPANNGNFISLMLSGPGGGGSNPFNEPNYLFSKISGKWNFHLQEMNLVLGRKFWLSPCFTLRPYAGLEGALTKTGFTTISTLSLAPVNDPVNRIFLAGVDRGFKDKFKNKFWGIGLLLGMESHWYLGGGFNLFGDFNLSLLEGKFKKSKAENYFELVSESPGDPLITPSFRLFDFDHASAVSHRWGMQPIIDLELGVGYEKQFCEGRYQLAMDLAWEQQYWHHLNRRNKYTNTYFSPGEQGSPPSPALLGIAYAATFQEAVSDLTFGGLTIKVRFDF